VSGRNRPRWCAGVKIRHQTYQTAADHVAALVEYNARHGLVRPGKSLGVYFCEACEAFHVGHGPENRSDVPAGNEEMARAVSLPPPGPEA
jgi:hypothetical protein